jgi:hypothetical protein
VFRENPEKSFIKNPTGHLGKVSKYCPASDDLFFGFSVVDPKLFFFGSGSYLDLNFGSGFGSGSGSGLFMKKRKRNSDDLSIAKKPDCLEKLI